MRRLVSVLATCSFIIATASVPALAQSTLDRPDMPVQVSSFAKSTVRAPALARQKQYRPVRPLPQQEQASAAGFTTNSLVSEARKYIGSNPTGRASLWCGAFMDLVLKRTGHKGGGNLASAYARYGTRVSGPQVGAIAVMGRNGGGHVGIVTGVDPNGNPIVISGNTWSRQSGGKRAVLEHVYPRSRVYAYVMP